MREKTIYLLISGGDEFLAFEDYRHAQRLRNIIRDGKEPAIIKEIKLIQRSREK